MKKSEELARAYEVRTPEDSVRLYREWAESYDEGFAREHGYVAPREIAAVFRAEAGGDAQPVLDIGAGTGLVGAELRDMTVDGIDISQEMLDLAAAKGIYRRCITADLTKPLDLPDAGYGGLVSSGTFTQGHVGPACLPELMRIARPDALFVLAIRPEVFDGEGFGSAFAGLVAEGAISPVDFRRLRMYENAEHDHAGDTYLTAVFRRR